MTGIGQGVDVQGNVGGGLIEGGDEIVEEEVVQPPEGGNIHGVLEAREGRLAGQGIFIGLASADQLEDGIGAQGVVVVAFVLPPWSPSAYPARMP